MPNFVVIGAAKGGTTSLYRYLRAHPDVFMTPVKEPNFFAYEGRVLHHEGPRDGELGVEAFSVTRLEDYQRLFSGWSGQRAVGEASPFYLHEAEAPARMARYIPGARLIAVLRDPAERAFSNWVMFVRDRRECLGFRRALRACEARRAANWAPGWQYVELGFYARNLQRYLAHFPRERLWIGFYEDLCADPVGFYRNVLEFLGVDPTFRPDVLERHNVSSVKRRRLDRLLNRPNVALQVARAMLPASIRSPVGRFLRRRVHYRPRLAPADRARLVAIYREDILELQRLTGRDLSAWLR